MNICIISHKRKPGARIEGGRLLFLRCPLICVDYLLAARTRGPAGCHPMPFDLL